MFNINNIIGKFIRNSSQREIDQLKTIVKKISSFEAKIKQISDESFPIKTSEFKNRLKN